MPEADSVCVCRETGSSVVMSASEEVLIVHPESEDMHRHRQSAKAAILFENSLFFIN